MSMDLTERRSIQCILTEQEPERSAAQVAEEGLAYPEKALISGPVGVMAREVPGLTAERDAAAAAVEQLMERWEALEAKRD